MEGHKVGTLVLDGWAVTFDTTRGTGRGRSPPRPLFAVPNITAHPSTASVLISVLLYNGPLLCGFNVAVQGLRVYTRPQVTLNSPWLKR